METLRFKINLKSADPDGVSNQMEKLFDVRHKEILRIDNALCELSPFYGWFRKTKANHVFKEGTCNELRKYIVHINPTSFPSVSLLPAKSD
ncbi:hypothetical protein OS493_023752 [Desmophyllum pertusum]|uniref:Uncharacterized protein n=1 Tax=Desmophyllum pertusum TaxID=174260 RepID=A0A9W9YN89_9CNID|nr:hypothetical protein OS493_023752 [Desmophyllum pertusum]